MKRSRHLLLVDEFTVFPNFIIYVHFGKLELTTDVVCIGEDQVGRR